MKKIGFIDYYLDEWHANNYPEFFKKAAGEEMAVLYAYGEIDSPIGGMTNKEWSEKYNIPLVNSIDELVEKSDYIVVLSPDNPEMHLKLTDKALKSGKPVYIDKTFAPTKSDALRIFKNADENNTPCYSSSALFFADELKEIDKEGIMKINSINGGKFDIYLIHSVEQIIYLMGYDVKRVMYLDKSDFPAVIIEFADQRTAQIDFYTWTEFSLVVGYENKSAEIVSIKSNFFGNCIKAMTEFFKSGVAPVSHEQTIAVISVIEAAMKGKEKPFEWIEI